MIFEPRWVEKKSFCFAIAPHGYVIMSEKLFENYLEVFKASESEVIGVFPTYLD